ncbi:expressed unknown protein [Seminavis robusta]|uniref:USP8 dimerisation domain-containing protein n=1 Tax=Seminavis robusta TaxID=568900 RepID=A0A9N8DWK7_9STRA|nr:expressed unknown protein [Seminavis robusta]|eukprot:Sro301_g111940.1 n/a (623) ;mRNA; f:39426-41294
MTAQVVMEYREDDPSYWRRKALLSEIGDDGQGTSGGGISVSSFFPITRYYEAADKVLAAFEDAVGRGDLDSTFVYGKRFCTFCIESIPKHDYYLSAKYKNLRHKYTRDAETVLKHLDEVKAKMNAEERVKHKKRMELARQEAARREAERKRQEAILREKERAKYQELMKRAELQRQNNNAKTATSSNANGGKDVQASAMNKLELLMKQTSASKVATPPDPQSQNRPSGRYFLADTDDEETEQPPVNGQKICIGAPLPPPMPPPPAYGDAKARIPNGSLPPALSPPSTSPSAATTTETPPPYDFAINTQRHNPFLGPATGASYALPPPVQPWENNNNNGHVRPPSYNAVSGTSSSSPSHQLPDPPTKRYPTQSQQPPKRKKKVSVRQLRETARRRYGDFVQDGIIEIRPIDTYQGRYSQSTNGCTVISPLVVAHHLATSNGVLLPDREIKHVIDNECGPLLREIRGKLGLENHSLIIPSDVHDHLVDKNILKQDHFVGATGGNIINEEHIGEFIKLFQEKRKAGAALFFREHVVSIIKIPVGGGRAYYDLVDSMPGTKDARNNPCASRTRCKSEEALDVLLKWYATKKFTESNCSYIDNNGWNDMMADLDPRVFQGFVWGKDE